MSDQKLNYFINKYKKEIKILAQVGAHFGQEIRIFQKYNFDKIILFEPNTEAVEALIDKSKDFKNIQIYPFALGNTNKKRICITQVKIKDKAHHSLLLKFIKKYNLILNFKKKD